MTTEEIVKELEQIKPALDSIFTFTSERKKEAIDIAIQAVKEPSYAMGYQDGLEDGLDDIRPHGHWIGQNKDCRGYCDSFKCSECGALIYPNCVQTECDYPSCPFCLADMISAE